MTASSHDGEPIVRLSPGAPRRRRPGQACPDTVVAEARRLVETSPEPLGRIARRLGISISTVSKWALNGRWARPEAAPPRYGLFHLRPGGKRSARLFETRRGLREAEHLVGLLETAPPPAPAASGPALDRLAAALEHLDDAARAWGRPKPSPERPSLPQGRASRAKREPGWGPPPGASRG